MSLLIESIKIYNGRVYNIHHHDERCNAARFALFGIDKPIQLRKYIKIPPSCREGLFKCRIIYDQEVQQVEIEPYQVREIKKVGIVYDDNIQYPFKSVERPLLDNLRTRIKEVDEIIIVKNRLLTDAYYYNIVLEIDGILLTPDHPLLQGTMRSKLLKQGAIKPYTLYEEDLHKATRIFFINALTGLGQISLSGDQILQFKK